MLSKITRTGPSRSTARFSVAFGTALAVSALLFVAAGPTSASSATAEEDAPTSDAGAVEDGAEDGAEEGTGDDATDPEADAMAAQLREGQQVYSQICSSCHQPGGAGLVGQYPPLINNPNVDDADYVEGVIINGRQGEIIVDGETYDGVMPSFSTLTDEEITAVIAYVQNDFVAPAAEAAAPVGPVAGTELPALTNMGALVAYLLAAAVAALVLAPRLLSENSRLSVPWLDAWLKTAVIVTAVVFLTVVVPDWALKQGAVAKLSRFGQDLIGTTLWAGGLAALLFGLWYAHRESRI